MFKRFDSICAILVFAMYVYFVVWTVRTGKWSWFVFVVWTCAFFLMEQAGKLADVIFSKKVSNSVLRWIIHFAAIAMALCIFFYAIYLIPPVAKELDKNTNLMQNAAIYATSLCAGLILNGIIGNKIVRLIVPERNCSEIDTMP